MRAVGVFAKNNFVDSINHPGRDDIVLNGLGNAVKLFCNYSTDVTTQNIAEILFELFHKSLEYIVNPELENDRKIRQGQTISNCAKGFFGFGLTDDCKYTCSMPLCGNHLQT